MKNKRSIDDRFVSIVIPAWNEQECIEEITSRLTMVMTSVRPLQYEILFVDDGSTDETPSEIARVAKKHPFVRGVRLSRNSGHQNAMGCGLKHAVGHVIITMDADLQHPPETIPQLIQQWEEGFDVVNSSRRICDHDSFFYRHCSKVFYKIFNRVADIKLVPGGADFRLLDRKALNALNAMEEHFKFYRGQVSYIGFSQSTIEYDVAPRHAGARSYTLMQSMRLAINGLFGFSTFGLKIPIYFGIVGLGISLIYIVAVLVNVLLGNPIMHPGWLSVIAILMIGLSLNFLYLGTLSIYLSKIFMEVKRRPAFFVESETGQQNDLPEGRKGAWAEKHPKSNEAIL